MAKPITHLTDMKAMAMLIAIVIRNAMEDFHVKHLPDTEMKELNQTIRNAAFTALHAARSMSGSLRAREWVNYQLRFIPEYWEQPALLSEYVDSIDPKNDWLSALIRGELAPSISSTAGFDG